MFETIPLHPETKKLIDEVYFRLRSKKKIKSYDQLMLRFLKVYKDRKKIKEVNNGISPRINS